MYCPMCGARNPDDARFCMQCRADLAALRAEPARPTAAAPESLGMGSGPAVPTSQTGRRGNGRGLVFGGAGIVVVVLAALVWLVLGGHRSPTAAGDAAGQASIAAPTSVAVGEAISPTLPPVSAPAATAVEPAVAPTQGPTMATATALPAQPKSVWQVVEQDGATQPAFHEPIGVAVDGKGNVYVTEFGDNSVQKLSSEGKLLARWGSAGGQPGQFQQPENVAVDRQGNVYVADWGNNRIQKLSPEGKFLAQWGSLGTGPGQFNGLWGVAVDGQGNVYVVDVNNNRVQKLSPEGKPLAQWGSFGTGLGELRGPEGVALDAEGNVYVADTYNHRIQKLSPEGKPLAQWGSEGAGPGQFEAPLGIALDTQGNIYVVGMNDNRIQKLSPDGRPLTQWGAHGSGPGQFRNPRGVALDGLGNVYVADYGNNRIQKLTVAGQPATGTGTGASSENLIRYRDSSHAVVIRNLDTGQTVRTIPPPERARTFTFNMEPELEQDLGFAVSADLSTEAWVPDAQPWRLMVKRQGQQARAAPVDLNLVRRLADAAGYAQPDFGISGTLADVYLSSSGKIAAVGPVAIAADGLTLGALVVNVDTGRVIKMVGGPEGIAIYPDETLIASVGTTLGSQGFGISGKLPDVEALGDAASAMASRLNASIDVLHSDSHSDGAVAYWTIAIPSWRVDCKALALAETREEVSPEGPVRLGGQARPGGRLGGQGRLPIAQGGPGQGYGTRVSVMFHLWQSNQRREPWQRRAVPGWDAADVRGGSAGTRGLLA